MISYIHQVRSIISSWLSSPSYLLGLLASYGVWWFWCVAKYILSG